MIKLVLAATIPYLLLLAAMLVWDLKPYKGLTWLCHGIVGWHKPDDSITIEDLSIFPDLYECSHCRFCGKKIYRSITGDTWYISEIWNRAKMITEEVKDDD